MELTDQQRELFIDLCNRGSVQSLRYAVKDKILADFQTVCVAIALIMEKQLISLDTGLGKTLVATAIINILHKKYPGIKWLYLCQSSNLKTTCDKVESGLYTASCIWTGADKTSILKTFFKNDALSADVLILPYNILENKAVNDFLFRNRGLYQGVVVDESQTIGNDESYTFRLVDGLLNNTRFGYLLSATPLRVDPEQVCNQIAIMDRARYGHMRGDRFIARYRIVKDGQILGYQNLDELEELLLFACISYTRKSLNMKGKYNVQIVWCDPLEEYKTVSKMETFSKILGDPAGPTVHALVKLCCEKNLEGKKGLVYVNRTENKVMVQEALEQAGLRVGIMDGKFTNTQKKKEVVHQQYINGELDVLITNVSTGKDLPSDYICFYEMTFDFKQMLGRGERGLTGNNMDIVFILVRNTGLVDYFYKNMNGVCFWKKCLVRILTS